MILTDAVAEYLGELHRPKDEVLVEMYEHARRDRVPVVGQQTGSLLELMARAMGAQRAVEVGTGLGVSTLRLARGGTHVISYEIDAERRQAAQDYLDRAGLAERVDLRLQDADVGLAQLEGPFDLAFLDGPKTLYSGQVDTVLPLLRKGGLLMIDNALMSGSAATQQPIRSWTAEAITAIRTLNQRLVDDRNLVTTVTPIGDGVTVAVKR